MNADSADRLRHDLNDEITQTLIARCGLSADTVRRVEYVMLATQLSFAQAAIHIGVAAPAAVEEVVALARASAARAGPQVTKKRVRRRAASKNLIVRPRVLVKPSRQLVIAHSADGLRSEAIRALRTQLLLLDEPNREACMLAVLSPSSAEGRSQLAGELAIAFSQLGRPTLLVDADLRNPRQHALFCTKNVTGLTQALAIGVAPELFGVDGFPHLSLLTSGPPAPNPSELLSSGRLEWLVGVWRQDFQVVVVDTPPVARYSDGLIVASHIGRVLLLNRAHVTAQRDMKEMLRRLGSTQSRIVGSVINRF